MSYNDTNEVLNENKRHRIYYVARDTVKMSPKSKGLLLSKAIEGFTLACMARRLSVHTITDYSRTLKKFVIHVGDTHVNEITTTQISAFLAAQPFSKKTVLNYHIGLAALWTWMTKEGYVERNIVRLVDKPRPRVMVVNPFTEVEIRAMLTGIRRNVERDRCVILLLLDTGMRASELCNMQKKDVDLAQRHISVLGKGDKERILPFSPRTASLLFKYMADVDSVRPFPFTRTSLAHLIQQIGKRAGVEAHPHRFRHTFAVTYLRSGGDAFTLQAILGHTTMEMVRLYLAIAQVDLDAAHRRASPVENMHL